MKILIVGLLAFLTWSTFSYYIYVCKIRGFCNERAIIEMFDKNPIMTKTADTIQTPIIKARAVKPVTLVVYFDFDKSVLTHVYEADKYYTEAVNYLKQNEDARLSITGHTDATGSIVYNQALGYRRAQSLRNYFESKGIQTNRIIIESKGEKEPADNNNTIDGRTKNRRTEITINN